MRRSVPSKDIQVRFKDKREKVIKMSVAVQGASSGQFMVPGQDYNIILVEPATPQKKKRKTRKSPSEERLERLHRALGKGVVVGTDGLTEITNVSMTPAEVKAFDASLSAATKRVLRELQLPKADL